MVETENKEKSSLDFTKSNAHVEDDVVHGEVSARVAIRRS